MNIDFKLNIDFKYKKRKERIEIKIRWFIEKKVFGEQHDSIMDSLRTNSRKIDWFVPRSFISGNVPVLNSTDSFEKYFEKNNYDLIICRCSLNSAVKISKAIGKFPNALLFYGEYGNFLEMDKNLKNDHLILNFPYVSVSFDVLKNNPLYFHFGLDSDEIFIKSNVGNKSIPGQTIHKKDVSSLVNRISLPPESIAIGSKHADIENEYRCVVCEGRIISGSSYVVKGEINESEPVPEKGIVFMNNVISLWNPDLLYVVDICSVKGDDNFKILEYNCFSTSGFYKTHDLEKITEETEKAVVENYGSV